MILLTCRAKSRSKIQEGFKGGANVVYQYLIKYAHENDIPYGHNSRVIPLEERNDHSAVSRPPRISIERASKQTIYESLLHTVATTKEEIKQSLLGLESTPKWTHPNPSFLKSGDI